MAKPKKVSTTAKSLTPKLKDPGVARPNKQWLSDYGK